MNFFEKFALAMLSIAEAEAPLFIKSANGVIILNATEPIVNGVVGALAASATPALAPAPPASSQINLSTIGVATGLSGGTAPAANVSATPEEKAAA